MTSCISFDFSLPVYFAFKTKLTISIHVLHIATMLNKYSYSCSTNPVDINNERARGSKTFNKLTLQNIIMIMRYNI